ncbi:MAG: endolytic transglycosylase MltG [Chloroflexota bacterium]
MDDRPRQHRGTRILLILALAVMLVVAASFAALILAGDTVSQFLTELVVNQLETPPGNDSTEVVFDVQKGESAGQIADRLEKEGIIRNADLFRLLARSRGLDQHLEAGEHTLRKDMRLSEVLDALQTAKDPQRRLTVLEGWRAEQIADELEFRGIAKKSDFLALVAKDSWQYGFLSDRPSGTDLEGYLFPDTYALTKDTTAEELVTRMLDDFGKRVEPAWEGRSTDLTLNLHETLTLASIIEREAQDPAERPLMAGVFLNRLRLGMPLQADPTVQYALAATGAEPADGYWKKALSVLDLQVDSPYNTYKYPGLPPGPICNPGLPAIEAVLHPADTDYLYFVAKGDGTHAFASTLEAHNENVQRYR